MMWMLKFTVALAGIPAFLASGIDGGAREIVETRVHLFCDQLGTLSPDITTLGFIQLEDTPKGGGDAPCASSSILVVFEISDGGADLRPESWLEVAVDEDLGPGASREIARDSYPVPPSDPDGMAYVPVLISDTGCVPLRIGARVRSSAGPSRVLLVPFSCSESSDLGDV